MRPKANNETEAVIKKSNSGLIMAEAPIGRQLSETTIGTH